MRSPGGTYGAGTPLPLTFFDLPPAVWENYQRFFDSMEVYYEWT